MLRALGPWGILIVVGLIGMCIWRFEGRRGVLLDDADDARGPLTDGHGIDHLAYQHEDEHDPGNDNELFSADEAIMANDQMPPIGPDDCPEFIETLERFVRPSE